MTQQIGTWRVQYRPGDWIVLSGPTSLVVLQPASGEWSELVTILWEQVVASATITDLTTRLAMYGVDTMPSFAALFWHRDGLRSLVRGDVSLTDLATGSTVAEAPDVVTWSEVGLAEIDHVEVVLPPGGGVDPGAMLLPLVVGAVRASTLVLDARTAALLTSPQGLAGSEPAAAVASAAPAPGSLNESAAVLGVAPPADREEQADLDSAAGPGLLAGAAVLPGVPPIGDAGGLGSQGYLGTEGNPDRESDPDLAAGDLPDTEPFDVAGALEEARVEEAGLEEAGVEEAGVEEAGVDNENADTELMYLPGAEDAPVDGDVPVDEDHEDANTELMSVPTASQPLDPEQVDPEQVDPEVPGIDVDQGTAGGSLIMAVTCPRLHSNPPPAGVCRICGEVITEQGARLVSRPVLARLRGPGGVIVELDRRVRIGRAPSADGDADQHLMTVNSPSQDISRTHLEIAPDGWQVIATDLHSTNGTLLVSSGGGMGPHALSPGEPVVLAVGAVLELGDDVTIVIDPPLEL